MLLDMLEAQVIALRAQVDAMYAAIREARGGEAAGAEPAGCPHLETENVGTFGAPELRCKACEALIAG